MDSPRHECVASLIAARLLLPRRGLILTIGTSYLVIGAWSKVRWVGGILTMEEFGQRRCACSMREALERAFLEGVAVTPRLGVSRGQ